jgi:hypothetical protein
MNYALQPSNLVPTGQPAGTKWGRRMVILSDTEHQVNITLTSDQLDDIALALAEGKICNLPGIGKIQPSITGGTSFINPISPTPADAELGFRPSKELLEAYRGVVSFSLQPTIVKMPTIISTSSVCSVEGVAPMTAINELYIGAAQMLTIKGSGFPPYHPGGEVTDYSITLTATDSTSGSVVHTIPLIYYMVESTTSVLKLVLTTGTLPSETYGPNTADKNYMTITRNPNPDTGLGGVPMAAFNVALRSPPSPG